MWQQYRHGECKETYMIEMRGRHDRRLVALAVLHRHKQLHLHAHTDTRDTQPSHIQTCTVAM